MKTFQFLAIFTILLTIVALLVEAPPWTKAASITIAFICVIISVIKEEGER